MTISSREQSGRLADFIRRHADDIARAWVTQADAPSSTRETSDRTSLSHSTEILTRIADYVDASADGLAAAESGDDDGDRAAADYASLRRAVLESWERNAAGVLDVAELRTLDLAFDHLRDPSVARFATSRERLLWAVDRVSTAALTSADSDAFLRDLLAATLEGTQAVHTGAVLLREEDRLRLRATVGLEEDVSAEFSVAMGQGFAGRVALEAQPLALRHAAEDPAIESPTIRKLGIRALYGVPMMRGGKVMGVAHFGSLTAFEFSEEDKLLFRAVVSRATSAVQKAQIVADLRRTEAAQRFLAEASRQFAETLDYEATLTKIASHAVPTIADWCIVDLLEDGRVKRVSVAHADPADAALADELMTEATVDLDAAVGIGNVLRSGKTEWRGRLTDADLQSLAHDTNRLELLRRLKLRAYVVVPIVAKGTLLGSIALVSAKSHRRYSEWDVTVAEDLAHRAAMAIENARLYREAKRAVTVREQVLATVSHDLRNQVNVVVTASELLLQTANLQETPSARPLWVIARTGRSMQHLVNDLLDLASIQAGQLSISVRPTPLAPLIEEAREIHEPAARLKRLRLIAEGGAEADVLVDRGRVLQVLSNLLGNAIKFTPPGGAVTIRTELTEREAVIAVIDTGRGIPARDVSQLFAPYRTIANDGAAGSGLGLFIARGIVERHGGRIWIDSRENSGTTVTFTLPAAR